MKFHLFTFLLFCGLNNSLAQTGNIRQSANRFLSSLDDKQRSQAIYSLTDEERFNWHFIPKTDRKGISLNELNAHQKSSAINLLKTCLSEKSFNKAISIIQLELILKQLENRSDTDHYRDPGKYFFTFFGDPSKTDVWGWRIDGHHLSFNFSAIDSKIIGGTPGFMGTNPAIVMSGPKKGMQILKDESDKAFQLLHSLSTDQLPKAIINTNAPNDIITYVNRKAMIEKPEGLTYAEMGKEQKEMFWNLVTTYVHRYTKLFAGQMIKEITDAGLDNLRFAWAGATEPQIGKPHYYRIQGPTLIIEYDNSQNNANHVHSVIRDLKHDFGGDELLEHYNQSHR